MFICEDGLVHYCSQQRGNPGTPLDQYSTADIRREYLSETPCAPYWTVNCVLYVSYFDFFRAPKTLKSGLPDQATHPLVKIQSAK